MFKFKKGDKAILINNDVRHGWERFLCIGKIYEVVRYNGQRGSNHPTVCLKIEENNRVGYWWVHINSLANANEGTQLLFDFMYER